MKKINLTILLSAISMIALCQQTILSPFEKAINMPVKQSELSNQMPTATTTISGKPIRHKTVPTIQSSDNKHQKSEKELGWVYSFEYMEDYYFNSSTNTPFTLLPDTCLRIYTNYGNWNAGKMMGIGTIFDPFSQNLIDTISAYKVDTLKIHATYILGIKGYNASKPDTLRIYLSYYEPYKNIGKGKLSSPYTEYQFISGTSLICPKINESKSYLQKGSAISPFVTNTIKIDYVLKPTDVSRVWDSLGDQWIEFRLISIPLNYKGATVNGFIVPPHGIMGTMVKFIPGYSYSFSDTLYYGNLNNINYKFTSGYPIYRNNTFQLSVLENSTPGVFVDKFGYNTMTEERKYLRYQMYNNCWDSLYFPDDDYLPIFLYHVIYDVSTPQRIEFDTTLCANSYTWNNNIYTKSGTYKKTFSTSHGDSIVVLHLTLNEQPGTMGEIYGDTLITTSNFYTYYFNSVLNASSYDFTISNNKWSINSYTNQSVTLYIGQPGTGTLSIKALSEDGICESNISTLKIKYCNPAGEVDEIQGTANVTTSNSYSYSINTVENATGYKWIVENASWQVLGSVTSSSISLLINSSGMGTLKVRVYDGCGDSVERSFVIYSSVNVNDMVSRPTLSITPNPTEDKINIKIDNQKPYTLTMVDIFGKQLMESQNITKETTLDISSFASGIYFLQVKDNQNVVGTYKVIKK